MKTFVQFQEDVSQLRRQLNTISRQDAPAERLAARRAAAKERSRTAAAEFQQRTKAQVQEQTPTMDPNYYSQQVARRQAAQKSARIKHVDQEIGATARTQEAARQRRLKAIMSRG